MRKIIGIAGLALVLGLVCTTNAAVIAGYDFDDGTGTPTTAVTVKDANVNASDYDTGAGLNTITDTSGNSLAEETDAEGNVFGTANQISFGGARSTLGFADHNNQGTDARIAQAMNQGDYMTFTVTPTNGCAMNLTSFTFRTRANNLNNSAERWALFSSVDGFTFVDGGEQDDISRGRTSAAASWGDASTKVVVDLSDAKFQNLTGAVEFRLVIYAGNQSSSSATLFDKVIVNGTVAELGENVAPTANEQSVSTTYETPVEITLSGFDPEGSNLTYSVESQPTSGSLSGATNVWTYTPANGYFGADSFTFTVNDGETNSAPATVSISVDNMAPVADAKVVLTQPDTAVSVVLSGSDADSAPGSLTFSVTSQPANGVLSGTEPNLTYTPTNGFAGTDSFTYTANDGLDDSAEATVSITVSETGLNLSFLDLNSALSGNTLNVGGSADNLAVSGVSTNNDYVYSVSYTGADYDRDGSKDTLTFDVWVKGWNGSITDVPWDTPNTSGTTASAAIGTNAVAVAVGDRFSAGGNMANGETLEFILENISLSQTDASMTNQVSSAGFTSARLEEFGGNSHQAVIGEGTDLRGYDFNDNVTALPLSVSTGSFYISADNPTTGTTPASWGIDHVDFGINVVAWDPSVNQVPVADAQSVTTSYETPVDITLAGSDVDAGPSNLTYSVVSQPTNGTVVLAGDVATYTPTNGYLGADSFTFIANDGETNSAAATVSITVENAMPVADAQSVTTFPDTAVEITLAGSDLDEGPGSLVYTVETQPTQGTLTGATNVWIYTPTNGYTGADSFTFTVSDGLTNSTAATVSITVVNQVPVAEAQSVETYIDTPTVITLTGTDSDEGPDALTYVVETLPANGTLVGATNVWTYTPTNGTVGADSFTFTVNDGLTNSEPATVSIEVVNSVPVAEAQRVATTPDTAVVITLAGSDVDGPDSLTYAVVDAPTNGTFAGADNVWTYTPTNGYIGGDSLIFTVNDGLTNSAAATVSITVANEAVNIIAGYDFDDGTGSATTAVTVKDALVTASDYGVGAGLLSVVDNGGNSLAEFADAEGNLFGTANPFSFGGAQSVFGFTDMSGDNNLTLAIDNNDYMTFTVTPDEGYELDLARFTFRTRVNQYDDNAAERWALFSSVDGFEAANVITNGRTMVNSTYVNNVVDLSAAGFQNLTEATEFRLVIYGGDAPSNSATLFDKVILHGTVEEASAPVVGPTISATVSGGSLIMSWEGGGTYNVLTNASLLNTNGWGVATNAASPVTNALGSESQLFFKLSE